MKGFASCFTPVLLLITLLSVGCQPSSKDVHLLHEARSLIDSVPGEAFNKLQAIRNSQALPDSLQAEYNLQLTKCQLYLNLPGLSDSCINKAIDYYQQANDSALLIKALYFRGIITYRTSDIEASINIALPLHDTMALMLDYQMMGTMELSRNQPEKAIENFTKAIRYSRQINNSDLTITYLINLAEAYRYKKSYDVAIKQLNNALTLSERTASDHRQIILKQLIILYKSNRQYEEALACTEKLRATGLGRGDIPSWNLTKAILFDKQLMPDSACHYAQIAINGNDPFVADVAYTLLKEWEKRQRHYEEAVAYQDKIDELLRSFEFNLHSVALQQKYEREKLKNENNLLKIKQKEKDILLLIIVLVIIVTTASLYIVYLKQKKRHAESERIIQEELLRNRACQLEQENRLLKQNEEISRLREKEALLRESLIRRINFFNKLPSLSDQKENDPFYPNTQSHKILFTENDWNELIRGIDEVYPRFSVRLRQAFPMLDDDDIRFCCLVKINVNLQDLSDIYCLSKAGITKKKYRLKKDKLTITDPAICLDDYLTDF